MTAKKAGRSPRRPRADKVAAAPTQNVSQPPAPAKKDRREKNYGHTTRHQTSGGESANASLQPRATGRSAKQIVKEILAESRTAPPPAPTPPVAPPRNTPPSAPTPQPARRATRAVVLQDKAGQNRTADKFTLLEAALAQAEFWEHLHRAQQQARRAPAEFRILIKPDLGLFAESSPTGTDPALVEHLIDLLHERGYEQVIVGEGRNSFDRWLENRDILVLADLVGYRFTTDQSYDYEVIDLGEELVEVPFPAGSALHGTELARAWVEADYRICFAKNKTDEENFYALCLASLLGLLPLRDKDYHYRHRLKAADVCAELLKQTPVHFSLIDAYTSNHGSAGARAPRPLKTCTLIASPDLLLADWAGAVKMGLDPFASPVNAKALHEIGLPVAYEIAGDLTPYADWINVHPLIADSTQRRNQSATLNRALKPWLQAVDAEKFPFKDVLNERLNKFLAGRLAQVDDNPAAFWALVGLNYSLGAAHDGLEAFRTLYDKERLHWREVPLGLEPSDYPLAEYEGVAGYLEPLAELIRHTPADRNSLRWRYLDGSVLFEFSRLIHAPYDDFVARVEIHRAIEFMNDYIGGVAVPVARDELNRVTHQAERNLYLPQPNYLALYQGDVIDVTKLEFIRYEARAQKIYWKTIKSENGSAAYDDGIVTFANVNGETLVTVMGRQQFTLPLFWQAVNLDLNPALKDFLVTHAYTTFFTQTLANFEAKYEGRAIRIGRSWNPAEGEPGSPDPAPGEQIAAVLGKVGEVVTRNWQGVTANLPWKLKPKAAGATEVDDEGFVHFKSASGREPQAKEQPELRAIWQQATKGARGFFTDLSEAMKKDAGLHREDD